MALNAYLKLVGTQQGEIRGGVIQKGREGRVMVIAVDHEIISPRDAASGLATGRRNHRPLVITKELDQSSPLLWKALASNEEFSSFELQFFKPQKTTATSTGVEVQNYTIKLTRACIAGIHFAMPNNKNPELLRYAEFEEVSFSYQKIEWIWTAGAITASDSWT